MMLDLQDTLYNKTQVCASVNTTQITVQSQAS